MKKLLGTLSVMALLFAVPANSADVNMGFSLIAGQYDTDGTETEKTVSVQTLIDSEKDSNETSLDESKEDEIISKIKFYQDENTRLSSEIIKIKKNYETIKDNFTDVENQKNDIFKKVKELNSSLIKNNIVGTPFIKETIEEDSISSKILNDITNKNLNKEKKKTEKNNNLDEAINNIFK